MTTTRYKQIGVIDRRQLRAIEDQRRHAEGGPEYEALQRRRTRLSKVWTCLVTGGPVVVEIFKGGKETVLL